MVYIGIDPGLDGAVAHIDSEGNASVFDTPTFNVEGKRKYNAIGMAALLVQTHAHPSIVLVVLESVHSMPKQGVASSFCFGEGLGIWKGIIAANGMSLELPSPQRWKKTILADQGKDKDASRYKAIQIFPALAEQLKLKKHDGRAEALLLAEYGRRLRTV